MRNNITKVEKFFEVLSRASLLSWEIVSESSLGAEEIYSKTKFVACLSPNEERLPLCAIN